MFDSYVRQLRLAKLGWEVERVNGPAAARTQLRLGEVYDFGDCKKVRDVALTRLYMFIVRRSTRDRRHLARHTSNYLREEPGCAVREG